MNTDLTSESLLSPDIQFRHPMAGAFSDPKAVFLTGASGFFGAYLLHELLNRTTADIYCLLRCKEDMDSARQRIEDHLNYYSLQVPDASSRIIPIAGDLSLPLMGLSERNFEQLAGQIDSVYHNGALVNAVYPQQF